MFKTFSRISVALLALVALVVGFAGRANVALAQDTADIAVLLPDSASSARWENDDRRFLSAAFDAAGVSYSIVNAEGDARAQLTQAEQAITNGAKVLLMVNLDSASGAAIIELARANDVKVIDYDRLTIEGPGADFYVSFDNESVGRIQGEGLVAAVAAAGLESPVRVAVLNGSPTDNNATLFANGYNSVIDPLFESGEWVEVADQSVPDWDNQQALVIFEQMLTDAAGDIDAAIAANDGLAGSVIAALQNQGLPFIPVTGQDATVGGIQNILAGRQSMTVYKAIKAQAEAAASLAIALVNGEDTSMMATGAVNNGTNDIPSVLLVPVGVTAENIAETVIADGFRTWEEICVGEFEAFCPPVEERVVPGAEGAAVEGSIAVLLPDSASSARWENDDRRFLSAAFEEAGVEYSIVNAEGDARTQLTQAEQAITNGAKVLLMVNLDSASGAAIIELARANGVAVIDYDRLTIEGPGADFYVSFDNEAVGRIQGEGLVAAVEAAGLENPNVAVLNGSPTDNNATLFANGYNSVITPLFDSGDWTLVADQSVPDWDNQQALVIFEQMLTDAGGEIDAAIAANDGLAGAVIAALQNQGLPFIPVTGQDATVGGIQNILAGRQSMTVYKAIKAQAEAAAELAIAILMGEDTSMMATGAVNNGTNDIPSVLLVPVGVTVDNIAETVIADGFRTWEEICVGEFEEFCPADR
ncbi:MAG: substrate-binding domain-containing protein [Chloroflexota bacterium]|nr:substrate-binding domain-containing protein [Chloroflexota bacterium]